MSLTMMNESLRRSLASFDQSIQTPTKPLQTLTSQNKKPAEDECDECTCCVSCDEHAEDRGMVSISYPVVR